MANTPFSSQTVSVEGLSDLEDALKELPKATAKNTIRRALAAAGNPIADEATLLIKVRRIQPAVVETKVKFDSGNAGKQAYAAALRHGATKGEAAAAAHQANIDSGDDPSITSGVMSIGPTKRAFYGFEFGTIHQSPKPFMRPAWDQNKSQALELIKTELKAQIEKARIRIVQKQLRLLAQMNVKA